MKLTKDVILKSYFWNFSVYELAQGFRMLCGSKITADDIEAAWQEAAQSNALFNQARPKNGFPASDATSLAQRLVA